MYDPTTSLATDATLEVGQVVDRYTIRSVLGEGGMATIYEAVHQQLGSTHAIKVLQVHSPVVRERLLEEGRVQATLRHPNLVMVTDVIDIGGIPALVMEHVEGPTLEVWLQEHPEPPLEVALGLFRGIVQGVAVAHDAGRIHRDLKPANVLLRKTQRGWIPKVTDFGLVKLMGEDQSFEGRRTLPGLGLGTPQYMSPQQIHDASSVDQRADLFALGCILYELVCGRRAFDGPDQLAIYNAVVSGTYIPPQELVDDLPQRVVAAIDRLLAPDVMKRIGSCEVLLEILYSDLSGAYEVSIEPRRSSDLSDKLTPILTARATYPAWPSVESEAETPIPSPHLEPALEPEAVPRALGWALGFAVGVMLIAVVGALLWSARPTLPAPTVEVVPEGPGLSEVLEQDQQQPVVPPVPGDAAPASPSSEQPLGPTPVGEEPAVPAPATTPAIVPVLLDADGSEISVDAARGKLRAAREALQNAKRRERDEKKKTP